MALWSWVSYIRPETSVYFEECSTVSSVRTEIIVGLKKRVRIKEAEDEEKCDVRMYFCPIVSRAGTDITAVLARVKADKPTFVLVLQHTFDEQAVVPSGKEYERERLVLVTFLFSEYKGLLVCQKNNDAFNKANNYLNKWAPISINKQEKYGSRSTILPFLLTTLSVITGYFVWRWYRPTCRPVLKQPLYVYFPV